MLAAPPTCSGMTTSRPITTTIPPVECYGYTFGVCQDPPRKLGGMMAFWVTPSCQPSNGDVDGNGCVDDADLLSVLFAFGGSGGPEDTNCDGVVDDADLLECAVQLRQRLLIPLSLTLSPLVRGRG
jgi:hypothetical protein